MKTAAYSLLMALIILLSSACGRPSTVWHATDISGIMPPLSFTLTNSDNKIVTASSFQGKINILFFGYTHCPDVCPMTLGKLAMALRHFPPTQRKQFNVLFVSVDPTRDTPAVRKHYCAAFGPEFHGLSGTQEQLKALSRRYRVTYGYGKKDSAGDYVVSHSSAMYIFNPSGEASLLVKGTQTYQALSEDLAQLLAINTG